MTTDERPSVRVPIPRVARIPDPVRLARFRQAPELGPRLLFFSGGSAIRGLSRRLVEYTHNSVHLITPFDSGGSSAELRRAFHMPAVGDLRNRLMALADQSVRGNPEIYALFAFRFPVHESADLLTARLAAMVVGSDELVARVPEPLQAIVRSHLGSFRSAMPASFDLRGAAVGNLVLAGGYLSQNRSLDSVLYLFSRLVEARGTVRPVVDRDLHLVAELDDGRRIVGQHRITGRTGPVPGAPIRRIFLAGPEPEVMPCSPRIGEPVERLIEGADLVCYPVGSFYTSLVATLLPQGVADAVARSKAPKVYVPNPHGVDPEEIGLGLPGKVAHLLAYLKEGAAARVATEDLLHLVLVDAKAGGIPRPLLQDVERQGVTVVDAPLVSPTSAPLYDDTLLSEALLSLS